jgi:hypothetical protein
VRAGEGNVFGEDLVEPAGISQDDALERGSEDHIPVDTNVGTPTLLELRRPTAYSAWLKQ